MSSERARPRRSKRVVVSRAKSPRLHNQVRDLRIARGLSLSGLAERMDTQRSLIQKVETGDTQLTLHWMLRLAAALECYPSDLLLPEHVRWNLSDEEAAIISMARGMTADRRAQLLQIGGVLAGAAAA